MKVKLDLVQIEINTGEWLTLMDRRLSTHINRSAARWINSIVFSVIPIWSGASRATFVKLAREVNFPLSIGSASPTSSGSDVSPMLGFRQSSGEVEKNKSLGLYTFTYSTTLFHLVFNEQYDANSDKKAGKVFSELLNPGPYNFREVGREAFETYAREKARLPSPWRTIRRQNRRVR